MASVSFQTVEGVDQFSVQNAEGKTVTVSAGKPFSSSDIVVIRDLDAASHAVKRVKKEK